MVTGGGAGDVVITANVTANGKTTKISHAMDVKEVVEFTVYDTTYSYTLLYTGKYECYSDDTWNDWFEDGEFVKSEYICKNGEEIKSKTSSTSPNFPDSWTTIFAYNYDFGGPIYDGNGDDYGVEGFTELETKIVEYNWSVYRT